MLCLLKVTACAIGAGVVLLPKMSLGDEIPQLSGDSITTVPVAEATTLVGLGIEILASPAEEENSVLSAKDSAKTMDCPPEAYFDDVISKLQSELDGITPALEQLELSVDDLTREINAKSDLLKVTRELAANFRCHYRQTLRSGQWPVEICGEQYSRDRVESQICRLAARAMAIQDAISQLQAAREQAEESIESIEGRPTRLTAEIIVTRMLQRLYRVQQLPQEGSAMLARARGYIEDPGGDCNVDQLLEALDGSRFAEPIDSPRRNLARRYLDGAVKPSPQQSTRKGFGAAGKPIFSQK